MGGVAQRRGATARRPEMALLGLLLGLLLHAAAASAACPNSTASVGAVIGSGSLRKTAAHSAELCCALCRAEPACAAYTFEKKASDSACFLKDNVVPCGTKAQATSGVLTDREAVRKKGGACGANRKAGGGGYRWPPPSDRGSLWLVLALLFVVIVGGTAYLVVSEKRLRKRGEPSSFYFPAEDTWHASLSGRADSYLPEIVLLLYRLVVLGWALFILQDSYPNNLFYYTIWNFIMLAVYFFVASAHSVWGLALKRGAASQHAGWAQWLQLVLFEIELPVSALIVVMVWGYLHPILHDGNLHINKESSIETDGSCIE